MSSETYNKSSIKRVIGLKLYRYDEESDEVIIYRILHYKESKKTYKVYNLNTNKTEYIPEDEIYDYNKYTVLNPDGFIVFNIVNMSKDNNVKDVLVCLHKREETNEPPYVVCRQCIQDIFVENTILKKANVTMVGCSISRDTLPPNISFDTVLTFEEIKWSVITAIYLDDSLDSIKKFIFPGINSKKFDKVLLETKQWSQINAANMKGFTDNLYDLLNLNHFMNDFMNCFHILPLDFNIDKDISSQTGYQPFLYRDQLEQFRKLINRKDITMTYIYPYSKKIDMNNINREHILCKSKDSNELFIIGYDVVMD